MISVLGTIRENLKVKITPGTFKVPFVIQGSTHHRKSRRVSVRGFRKIVIVSGLQMLWGRVLGMPIEKLAIFLKNKASELIHFSHFGSF